MSNKAFASPLFAIVAEAERTREQTKALAYYRAHADAESADIAEALREASLQRLLALLLGGAS